MSMRHSTTTHLVQRLSLWVLGQALPETGALRGPARSAITAVAAAAAAGTILVLGATAGLAGLYFYLMKEGLPVESSLGIVGGIAVLLGFIAYFVARQSLSSIPDQLSELKLFRGHDPRDVLGSAFNALAGGFLEGLTPEAKEQKELHRGILDSLESLLERLEVLEESVLSAGAKAEADVVLELKAPRRRKAKR